MCIKIIQGVVVAILLPAALVAFGEDIVWTGAVSSTWDATTKNWKRTVDDVACAFANGDDVTIGGATPTLTLAANVRPSRILFDFSNSLAFGFGGEFKFLSGIGSFVKDGTGTLTLTATGGNQAFRDYNGDVTVLSGALVLSGANQYASFGGVNTGTFFVENGGTLQVVHRNCFGKVDALNGCQASVFVKKGGVFQIGPDGSSHTGNTIKNLTLDGGSLVFAGAGVGPKVGTLTVLGTFAVTGDVAQVVTDTTTYGNNRIGLAWQKDSAGTATSAARTIFDVADVTNDEQPDLVFEKPLTRGVNVNDVAGLVKKGAGTLRLAYTGVDGSSSDNYGRQIGPNGDIDVFGGTLDFGGKWTVPVPNALVQNVYVGTNATLLVSHPEAICSECLTTAQRRPLTRILVDHGTFRVACPGYDSGHCFLGDRLVLDDATLETTLDGVDDKDGALGAFSLGSLLEIKGKRPCSLLPFAGMAKTRMALLNDPNTGHVATEIRVADVTNDDGVDATIGYKLCDSRTQVPGYSTTAAAGFVKTGTGTLLLAPANTGLMTFSGNTEIREGTVRLDCPAGQTYGGSWFGTGKTSYLGNVKDTNLNANRTITIASGAALEFCQRNMLGGYGYGETGGNDITTEFIVRGTLRICGENSANSFGDITVDGGVFEYGQLSETPWGPFNFRGTFKVVGAKPVTLASCKTSRLALYPSSACVFDIADVTQDGAPDFISNLALSKPADSTYFDGSQGYTFTYGFVKRGLGTMALEKAMGNAADFDDDARVEAGAILFDDDFSKGGGKAVVSEGAAIGGTGRIAGVKSFAAGAGIVGTAGQTEPLEINGDFELPATGFVDIYVPAGTDPETVKARLLHVNGRLTGATSLSGWTVRLNGQTRSDLRVACSGKTLVAGNLGGLAIIIR